MDYLKKHSRKPPLRGVGMNRWLRLTARKTSSAMRSSVKSDNPAADAAANALAALLEQAKKNG